MDESVERVAQALVQARREGLALDERAWVDAVPDAATAYAVQDAVARQMGWPDARSALHWKAGAPNTQAQPTFAPLPVQGVQQAPAARARSGHFIAGIEAEVAFRLAREVSLEEALQLGAAGGPGLFDAMAVSIEVVDSRWQGGMAAPALLRLADLQAHGALTLGAWVPFEARDWPRQAGSVRIDGVEQGPYRGTHPCGDPLWVVPAWLQHVAARCGRVAAGTVVTTGTWCGMVWLEGPAEVLVAFEGIGEAALALR